MDRAELGRLIRFSVTGTGVAAFYVVAYVLLFHTGVPAFWSNLVAFVSAVAVQYVVQTVWTFRGRLDDSLQGMRFVTTVSLGLAFSTLISAVIGPYLNWPAWLAAVLVAVTLPVTNYIVFRFWVYGIGSAHGEDL